jgi:pre-rRNA-processing protein TSR3
MRSSGSTPRRTADPSGISFYLWVAGEDHARACTGRRLLRQGLVREVRGGDHPPLRDVLLLDPFASLPLGPSDRGRAARSGVLGIDCSWNLLHDRGAYPGSEGRWDQVTHRRRLPWLVATNPQHYGRLGELSTAEAFGAAAYLLGEAERARTLLDGFAGGRSFFTVNQARLAAYSHALGPEDLLRIEEGSLGGGT